MNNPLVKPALIAILILMSIFGTPPLKYHWYDGGRILQPHGGR